MGWGWGWTGDCGCCEDVDPQVPCQACIEDTAPEIMTVEFEGISNGSCSLCNSYNSFFEVPSASINFECFPSTLGQGCEWTYAEESLCDPNEFDVINISICYSSSLDETSIRIMLSVFGNSTFSTSYQKTFSGKFDCNDFNGVLIDLETDMSLACDAGSSTVKLYSGSLA